MSKTSQVKNLISKWSGGKLNKKEINQIARELLEKSKNGSLDKCLSEMRGD